MNKIVLLSLVTFTIISPLHGMEKKSKKPQSASQHIAPSQGSANRGLRRSNPTSPVAEEAKSNRGPSMRYTNSPIPYIEEC